MQRSVHANQPNDVVVLIAKATTKLMDRQAPMGMTKGGKRVGEGYPMLVLPSFIYLNIALGE
jgi:hypothetical protein